MADDKIVETAIDTIRTLSTFGASAPLKELQKKFGFEPDRVAAVARNLLGGR